MASVFLSYDRENLGKARSLAAMLVSLGHTVWWDRHIKGGAQFASEIEAALNAANKVIVLWSTESVRSAWVRDEAAVGRDTGRLVPVTIDGTEPPLGFRQFQTIDLTHWKGRSRSAQLGPLVEALGPATSATPAPATLAPPRTRNARPRLFLAAIAAVLAMIIGGSWWWARNGDAHTPVVVVESGNGSKESREVARELAVRLGDLQSARSDAFQLVSGGRGNADLVLQVSVEDGPTALRRDVSLLAARNRSILWSTSLQQPPSKSGDLSQQLTLASERALACALDALANKRDRIDPSTLKLYLSGCSRLEQIYGSAQ